MLLLERLSSMIKKAKKKEKKTFRQLAIVLVAKRIINCCAGFVKGEPEMYFIGEVDKLVKGNKYFKRQVVNECIKMFCEKI